MRIIRSARALADLTSRIHRRGARIGLVPTMGALHAGHLSLVRAAGAESDVVIVSIFVNPLQFGPHEDVRRYPRALARDCRLLRTAGAEIVFAPPASQLYPQGFQTRVSVDVLAQRWEGEARPGHFQGVATVVSILFHLTGPSTAYFGQKDYQQVRVVQRLVEDLQLPVHVRMLPTVREPDGLAMSSRNAYLKTTERTEAAVLYRALRAARQRLRAGGRHPRPIIEDMRRIIREAHRARIEYLAIVDAATLEPLTRLRGRVAILGAIRVGRTRLIDNLLVDVS